MQEILILTDEELDLVTGGHNVAVAEAWAFGDHASTYTFAYADDDEAYSYSAAVSE
jgi:hypothetical protein